MVDLSKLPTPEYNPLNPYHWSYDNIPIKQLAERDVLINNELENVSEIIRSGAGTQGNIANRINQSIDEDGNLLSTSIDDALHNIAEHADGSKTEDASTISFINTTLGFASVINPVSYVRMLDVERSKLNLIAEEATNIDFSVVTPSSTITVTEGTISLEPSDNIYWDLSGPAGPNLPYVLKPVLGVGTSYFHNHFYNVEPITANYTDFTVNSMATPYIEDSLRVFINGVKLNDTDVIYVPTSDPTDPWVQNKFTPDHTNGSFTLDVAITSSDIIRIDFDISLS